MKTKSTISDCCIIELNKIHDRAGNITFIENNLILPFTFKRIFYLYDVPGGSDRGGHAHHEMHHFIIAASGAFNVVLDDGKNKKVVELNRPYYGLHIPPGIWVELVNFSSGSISLNLVSTKYNELDYIRNYKDFLLIKSSRALNYKN